MPSIDPTTPGSAPPPEPHPLGHPERIGPFRILQVLGEGGMGVVYEAEQSAPVRRRVALKVMKVGMDTKEVVARFEAERQALAVMSHPGIAKVLDAGASDTGRPYFVMELVKGIPLTDYCDLRKLAMRERIELFIAVCQAVQHAHQKGVIHRDLKPSNVLVMEQDGTPMPKIIDFGIAKAINQRLTEKTLVTAYGLAMGTLAYMSPEQAEMSNLDVDTRADIYSLGVMLYQLLVGELPVDPEAVGAPGFLAQLVLRDTDAERPSARAATTGNRERLAELRGIDSGRFRKVLKGDLDWIVLKAMEKDRGRRYETANGLAMDLGRYLRNEPIAARPPTTWYRVRKFTRRNRVAVAAGTAVVAALVAGVVLATRAERVAQREAQTAQEVSDFLTGLFEVGDPSAAQGTSLTAKEILDRGAARIRSELGDRPLVQARLMATMGEAYHGLGRLDAAASLTTEALATMVGHGAAATDVARTQVLLAMVLINQGKFDRAETLNREALATFHRAYGDRYNPDAAGATRTLVFGFLRSRTNLREGETLLRTLLDRERAAAPEDANLANTMDDLCQVLLDEGDVDAARPMCLNALALRRRLFGYDNFGVAVSLQRAGIVNRLQGRYDDALAAYREALAMNGRLYGAEHIEEAWNHLDLSATFRAMGNADSALVHGRAAVRIRRAVLADDNPQLAEALYELATDLRGVGDLRGSAHAFGEALAVEERRLRSLDGSPAENLRDLLAYRVRRAFLLRTLGRAAEGQAQSALASRVLDSALTNGILGPNTPPLTLNAICWWGSLGGLGERVLPLCDAAVAGSEASMRPRIRDSRGLARALTGDYSGAAEDFEAYVARPANAAGVFQRRAWVSALRQGRNPLTREVLDRLILP
jgi:serine/threonine protein kinase/tetratricopeptide (TPR) repeat protein